MRGTIAFERLTCTSGGQSTANVRILLNDAVYRESTSQYIFFALSLSYYGPTFLFPLLSGSI